MDFGLTDEQRLIVETARAFVENELYPHEAEVERTGVLRPELIAELKAKAIEAGLYAANMPEEVGGGGKGHSDEWHARARDEYSALMALFDGKPKLHAAIRDVAIRGQMPSDDEGRGRFLLAVKILAKHFGIDTPSGHNAL